MQCSITCDGVQIGVASIEPLSGLAHGNLEQLPAFEQVYHHAADAAVRLREVRLWSVVAGDFAKTFARSWTGGRLGITDATGIELAVASVMVVTGTRATHGPRVVIDARPDMAQVEAFLRSIGVDDGGRSRPV